MFVMVIAVMSIAMGVAVQTASFQMQREKEAELIFRGQQYIEAIRLYKTKYGRYPMQLKEIYEAKPRVIRKKWKDPITDSDDWGIVFLGQEGGAAGQQGRRGQQLIAPGGVQRDPGSGNRPVETQTPFGETGTGAGGSENPEIDPQTGLPRSSFGDTAANRKMGPIIGVHSKSTDEAIKIYEGHTTYSEWKFVYREEQQQGRGRTQPRQPPVGWHPGDKLPRDGEGETGSGTGSGSGPPRPIATIPRP
jgi:type II secretory pathway pseudopilin PulG